MKDTFKYFILVIIIILFISHLGHFIEFPVYCEQPEVNNRNYNLFLIALFLVSVTLLSQSNMVISEITKEDVEIIKTSMSQILEILEQIKE